MEKLKKKIIEIPMNDKDTITQELWDLEDIANKINEIIDYINQLEKEK